MRGKSWIRDMLSQFLILVLFAVGVAFLYKKAQSEPEISEVAWVGTLFTVAVIVLAVMGVLFLVQLFSVAWLERFDPGDPASVQRLERLRRFRLPARFARLGEKWPTWRKDLCLFFEKNRWTMQAQPPFDSIGLRLRRSPPGLRRYDRVFVFYHPMLNVIIVDQVLMQCKRLIAEASDRGLAPSQRNIVLLATDMENRAEVSSAAAGAVNFLGRLDKKTTLYPMLLDLDGGRFFYPMDVSLMPYTHRVWYRVKRRQIRDFIQKQVPEKDDAAAALPTDAAQASDLSDVRMSVDPLGYTTDIAQQPDVPEVDAPVNPVRPREDVAQRPALSGVRPLVKPLRLRMDDAQGSDPTDVLLSDVPEAPPADDTLVREGHLPRG